MLNLKKKKSNPALDCWPVGYVTPLQKAQGWGRYGGVSEGEGAVLSMPN